MDADACFCQAEAAEGSQDHLVSLHPLTMLKDQSHMSKVLLTQVTKMYISGHSWEQSAQKDVWSHLIQFCRGIWPLLNAKPPHYILPFCRFLGRCALWKSFKKFEKSLKNCGKVWKSVEKFEKVWTSLKKVWKKFEKRVEKFEKVWKNLKKFEKFRKY